EDVVQTQPLGFGPRVLGEAVERVNGEGEVAPGADPHPNPLPDQLERFLGGEVADAAGTDGAVEERLLGGEGSQEVADPPALAGLRPRREEARSAAGDQPVNDPLDLRQLQGEEFAQVVPEKAGPHRVTAFPSTKVTARTGGRGGRDRERVPCGETGREPGRGSATS